MVWPAVIAAGASLVGGAIGNKADKKRQDASLTHATSEREAAQVFSAQEAAEQRKWSEAESARDRDFQKFEADLARQFSAAQAREQMQFQERLSSTQMQRAAEDLERAGLNRILALGQPAAAPSGAMAQSVAPSGSRGSGSAASSSGGGPGPAPTGGIPAMVNAVTQLQTAQSLVRKQKEEAELLKKQQEKTEQDTKLSAAKTDAAEKEGFIPAVVKEVLGGEGSTGKQVADASKGALKWIVGKGRELATSAREGLERTKEKLKAQREANRRAYLEATNK